MVKGEGARLVSIYFHEANQTTAPPAYVTSTTAGRWGVQDVTLYVTAFAHSIVRFLPQTENAFMRRVTVRFNSYLCLEPQKGSSSRGRTADWDQSVGTAVTLAGRNIFVTDCDIYSSGDVVSTLHNGARQRVACPAHAGHSLAQPRPALRILVTAPPLVCLSTGAAGAEYMHIARNRMWNGGTTHWGISWKQCIFEVRQGSPPALSSACVRLPPHPLLAPPLTARPCCRACAG